MTVSPDISLIDSAQANVVAIAARLATAAQSAKDAAAALVLADAALTGIAHRVAGGEQVSPIMAQAAVATARANEAFATAVLASIQDRLDTANVARANSTVLAYLPVFNAAVESRFSAARAVDVARASMTAALSDYDAATTAINSARSRGTFLPAQPPNWQGMISREHISESTERAVFAEMGYVSASGEA